MRYNLKLLNMTLIWT